MTISPPLFDEDPDSINIDPACPEFPRPLAILMSPPIFPDPLFIVISPPTPFAPRALPAPMNVDAPDPLVLDPDSTKIAPDEPKH